MRLSFGALSLAIFSCESFSWRFPPGDFSCDRFLRGSFLWEGFLWFSFLRDFLVGGSFSWESFLWYSFLVAVSRRPLFFWELQVWALSCEGFLWESSYANFLRNSSDGAVTLFLVHPWTHSYKDSSMPGSIMSYLVYPLLGRPAAVAYLLVQ